MKSLFIFLIIFAAANVPVIPAHQSQSSLTTNDHQHYYCPPCGCRSDLDEMDSPGNCPSCSMQLIPVKEGFSGKMANIFSIFFRQNQQNATIYDRLMYPAFLMGIFLALLLFLKSRQNFANIFLGLIVLTLALYPFQNRLSSFSYFLTDSSALVFLPISFILLLGPAIYFYIRALVNPPGKISRREYLHFLPFLLGFIHQAMMFLMPAAEKKAVYLAPETLATYNWEQSIAILLSLAYIVAAYRNFLSKTGITIRELLRGTFWPQKFLIMMTLFFAGWAIIHAINLIFFDLAMAHYTYYPLWLLIAIFMYVFSFEVFYFQRMTAISVPRDSRPAEYTRNISEPDILRHSHRLATLMESERPHLDAELTLGKLAERLDIKPKDLTVVLNHGLKKNFYDFINEYRVNTAREKLTDPSCQHLTILAIAYDSGFNSKSSFNAIFKKHVLMTPNQYKKQFLLSNASLNGSRIN